MDGIKVKGHNDLRRSKTTSGVVVNVNQSAYNARIRQKKLTQDRKARDEKQEKLIAELEHKLARVDALLGDLDDK